MKPRVFIIGSPGTGQAGTLKSYRAMAVQMNTAAGNEMLVLDAAKRYPHASFFGLNPGIIESSGPTSAATFWARTLFDTASSNG
jgi:hypothetical protein